MQLTFIASLVNGYDRNYKYVEKYTKAKKNDENKKLKKTKSL